MPRHRPQPWYAQFNQPPKGNPNHGRNRKPTPATHGDPIDGTGPSAGAPYTCPTATWRAYNAGKPIAPGQGASVDFKHGQLFTILWKEPVPPPIPYAGVRVGEIIGHRMWMVLPNLELCSFSHFFIWKPGATIEGDVDKVVHFRAPFADDIYGGTYCYRTVDDVQKELSQIKLCGFHTRMFFNYDYIHILGIAAGTIKCWGEVVEHESGYRAQYAKLQSLDSVIGEVDLLALQRKYLPNGQ